jgi:hypothetical protein
MSSYPVRWLHLCLLLTVVLAVIAAVVLVGPAQAGSSGLLKLKVRQCYGSSWMSGASVDVTIYRPGVGNVDSGSGTTDSVGYVEIPFDDLENGDEAHVIVTPSDDSQGSSHTYYWVGPKDRNPGIFDVGIMDSPCPDGWYDEAANIILCLHN